MLPGFSYEGIGWFAWNDHDNCYDMVFLNNMGELGRGPCRWSGDSKLIMTTEALHYGQPTVSSHVMELGDGGKLTNVHAHSIIADAEPQKTFNASYTQG